MVTLGEIIQQLRGDETQESLAARAGVSQTTIGNIEAGLRGAKGRIPPSLPRIAAALGKSTEEIMVMAGLVKLPYGSSPDRESHLVAESPPGYSAFPLPNIDAEKLAKLPQRLRRSMAGELLQLAQEAGFDIRKRDAA